MFLLKKISRPRALNEIQQERVDAKENMKAVMHVLQHVNIDFDDIFPQDLLQPVDRVAETRHHHVIEGVDMAFVVNAVSGESRFDVPFHNTHTRLVLAPDEGGPLFAAFQYLASKGAAVGLNRDESRLVRNCSEVLSFVPFLLRPLTSLRIQGTNYTRIAKGF